MPLCTSKKGLSPDKPVPPVAFEGNRLLKILILFIQNKIILTKGPQKLMTALFCRGQKWVVSRQTAIINHALSNNVWLDPSINPDKPDFETKTHETFFKIAHRPKATTKNLPRVVAVG